MRNICPTCGGPVVQLDEGITYRGRGANLTTWACEAMWKQVQRRRAELRLEIDDRVYRELGHHSLPFAREVVR